MMCSLWHAALQYRWRGDDLAAAKTKLVPLSSNARCAYLSRNPQALDTAAFNNFKWGGVMKGNAAWIKSNRCASLQSCTAIHAMHLAKRFSSSLFAAQKVRMNSGFTKLYALTFDEFIIYDSRVAAVLAFLVLLYEKKTGKWPAIKDDLRIFSGRSANRTIPGFKTKSTELSHARANFAANWLIQELFAKHPRIAFAWDGHILVNERFRVFEAALFMLGYNMGTNPLLA